MNIIISCFFLIGIIGISIFSFIKKQYTQGKKFFILGIGMSGIFYALYFSKSFNLIFYIFIIVFIIGMILIIKD